MRYGWNKPGFAVRASARVIAVGVLWLGVGVASAQSVPTTVGLNRGYSSSSGSSSTPPTLPYRDPQLDPADQTDYREPADVIEWRSPGDDWQIGVPLWYRGRFVYVVRDADAYIRQFNPAVQQFLVPYPASRTGLLVDLVEDVRGPVSGVSQYSTPVYGTRLTIGNREFRTSGAWGYYSGYSGWMWYGGLGPGYWYWLDQTPDEIDRMWRQRVGYRGTIDGQYVPGYTPIAAPPPVVVPTPRELGLAALVSGDSGEAVDRLLEHLNSPAGHGDWATRRLLAVALLAARRAEDAAAFMRLAYLGDPGLAFRPLANDLAGLPYDESGSAGVTDMAAFPAGLSLRRLAGDAGRYANEANSASGWLLLAVVLQAQGNNTRAIEVLGRAEQWKLEPEISLELRAALVP